MCLRNTGSERDCRKACCTASESRGGGDGGGGYSGGGGGCVAEGSGERENMLRSGAEVSCVCCVVCVV